MVLLIFVKVVLEFDRYCPEVEPYCSDACVHETVDRKVFKCLSISHSWQLLGQYFLLDVIDLGYVRLALIRSSINNYLKSFSIPYLFNIFAVGYKDYWKF